MNQKTILGFMAMVVAVAFTGCNPPQDWETTLEERLPVYGHRNWIVIADSAYPSQSASGIETVYTDASHFEVLETVLKVVEAAPHVQAKVMVDRELDGMLEADAPGVEAYRQQLKAMLTGRQVAVMPHEDIISQLDDGAELFNILLLKTDLTLPYTSVFLELDCGYWNADKEERLHQTL